MFVGIDVSKAKLDVAILPTGEVFQVDNSPDGIAMLVTRFNFEQPDLIVLEPSGGYEVHVLLALNAAQHQVALVHAGLDTILWLFISFGAGDFRLI